MRACPTCGAPQWVEAYEKKPNDSRDVLVLQKGGFIYLGKYFGYHGWNHINVTHWMDLPDLPEGGEE